MTDNEIKRKRALLNKKVGRGVTTKEYKGSDAVYSIVGQIREYYGSLIYQGYYNTLKHNWVKDIKDSTQYDSYSDAEEDLWDAENLFMDEYIDDPDLHPHVAIVSRKPRRGDHLNIDKEDNDMNIYEELNKINDAESLKEEDMPSKYSNRVEGNKRYFDTMGNKIRYCLLDVIRCKGYSALYRYMLSLDPDAFSAYAPDFATKLGDRYQDNSVDINRADTFGKIADDLQQQFIKMVSKVDSRKRSVYEDKTPEELWNNYPVEIDGEQYAKVQNLKKTFGID